MTLPANTERCKNHRFPGEIISHGVWLYYRFPLSYRDVQEMLLARSIDVTYEAIRHLEMAQRVLHHVVKVLAPQCIPVCLTDGLKDYGTALLAHFGSWIQPEQRGDSGPLPKPSTRRWCVWQVMSLRLSVAGRLTIFLTCTCGPFWSI